MKREQYIIVKNYKDVRKTKGGENMNDKIQQT